MFKCKKCNSIDKFELMFNPSYQGEKNFSFEYTKDKDIKITLDGFTFIPNLSFMNEHAVCRFCGAIKHWDYKYD